MNEIDKTNEISIWDKKEWMVDDAFAAQESIKGDIKESVDIAYREGLKLIAFKKNRGAVLLGYNSFEEWTKQPDIAFGKAQCYFLISMARVYKKLLQVLGNNFNPALLLNINIEKHRALHGELKKELDKPAIDADHIILILHEAAAMSTQELKDKYGDQTPTIRGYGTFAKIVGKSITINDIVMPYDASNQNYFKELSGKRVEFRIKLSPEPLDNDNG